MSDPVSKLRSEGRFLDALEKLFELLNEGVLNSPWRKHCLGDRCLLLEAARESRSDPSKQARLLQRLDPPAKSLGFPELLREYRPDSPSIELLQVRAQLVCAILTNRDTDALHHALSEAVSGYARCWAYQMLPDVNQVPTAGQPAFLSRLPSTAGDSSTNTRWAELFRNLAGSCGWWHPGLCLVGETAAFVWGNGLPPSDHRVQTWVLFAFDEPSDGTSSRHPGGLLGRLTLERVPHGCGAFSPDPLGCGYLSTPPDDQSTVSTFQNGLQHAWLAPLPDAPLVRDYDIRWSLELVDPGDKLPLDEPISGRSAEAAVACALRAIHRGEELDQHVAITAMFAHESQPPDPQPALMRNQLSAVESVGEKLMAPEFYPQQARFRRVYEVLVANDQQQPKPGTPIGNNDVRIIGVGDLDEAYANLARWPRITRAFKASVANTAQSVLDDRCGQDSYVLSSLSRERRETDLSRQPALNPDDRFESLSEAEVHTIIIGRTVTNQGDASEKTRPIRACLLAESGLGKSTFLVNSEHEIAQAADGRVPIRLTGLSHFEWTDDDAVIKRIANQHVAEDILKPLVTSPNERLEWFTRLLDHGDIVFLLDALDQTSGELWGFNGFLNGVGRRCPAIISGRPSILTTQKDVFVEGGWELLRVDPFDRTRMESFLGSELSPHLLNQTDHRWRDRVNYQRKQGWADLLQVPLLLHLMRDLAQVRDDQGRPMLDGLTSRYTVYERALDHLIEKGWETLGVSHQKQLVNRSRLKKQFREIAWETIRQVGFEAAAFDEDFEALTERLPWLTEFLNSLSQVDVTVMEVALPHQEIRGLVWRHLSFCEYFAGLYLARLDRTAQTEVVQQHGRDPRWRWVFRFALCCLERAGNKPARQPLPEPLHALARDLVRFGNPFLVYEAIERDRIEPLPPKLERLCRWLVCRDWSDERNYTSAWDSAWSRPHVDSDVLDILGTLFAREYRNSACLDPAWKLLEKCDHPRAMEIRQRFLREFEEILADASHPDHQTARSLVPEVQLFAKGLISQQEWDERKTIGRLNFARCPKNPADDGRPFWMGSPESDSDASADERPRHQVIVSPFCTLSTPVTNRQFELFDPSHRHQRDQYSPDDDTPVSNVSFYMARLFCVWLGNGSRFPTEAEWAYACRAGSTTRWCYGDDVSLLKQYAWYVDNSDAHVHPVGQLKPNAWDLYDMHGNVWEWCSDWYDDDWYGRRKHESGDQPTSDEGGPPRGSSRVLRGGSWDYLAENCRSAVRFRSEPLNRFDCFGFRVVLPVR